MVFNGAGLSEESTRSIGSMASTLTHLCVDTTISYSIDFTPGVILSLTSLTHLQLWLENVDLLNEIRQLTQLRSLDLFWSHYYILKDNTTAALLLKFPHLFYLTP
jgi:hypothetical protein